MNQAGWQSRMNSPGRLMAIASGPVLGLLVGLAVAGVAVHLDEETKSHIGLYTGLITGVCLTGLMALICTTKIPTLFHRTLKQYLTSPLSLLIIAAYLGVNGIVFYLSFYSFKATNVSLMFLAHVPVLGILYGLITMRLLAGERSENTLEGLMTSPVSDLEVIMGKYLGAVGFFFIMELPRVLFLGVLYAFCSTTLSWGEVLSNYVGTMLVIFHLAAIGMLCSALVREQFAAASLAIAYGIVFGMLMPAVAGERTVAKIAWLQSAFRQTSYVVHYFDSFHMGVITSSAVAFYVATTIFALGLATQMLGSQRWR